MGSAKRFMEEQENQMQIATQIAVQAGALTVCEYHGYVTDNLTGDDPAPYKLASYKFAKGELDGVFSSRQEMLDTVKAAIADAGMECPGCESRDRD